VIYLNNRIVPKAKARITVFDRGFLYGDGVYETLRVYRGVVYMVDEHIERLFRSASMIGLNISKSHEAIKKAVYRTIQANGHKEAYVRISVSRGAGRIGLDPTSCHKPTLVIISDTIREYPAKYYREGVEVAIVRVRRNYKNALNPQIKSLNFLNNILAKIESMEKNAYEAVMLNYRGYLAEGTITNIFFIRKGILHTPSLDVGILDGITRRIILEAASELKIKIREGKYVPRDLYNADEVFISNTTMEVMPVSAVDNKKIGRGMRKITGMLRSSYRNKVSRYVHARIEPDRRRK
jgi:branched-chain amino acid aminotransferase